VINCAVNSYSTLTLYSIVQYSILTSFFRIKLEFEQ
jgi:hypothetical protein